MKMFLSVFYTLKNAKCNGRISFFSAKKYFIRCTKRKIKPLQLCIKNRFFNPYRTMYVN